LRAHRLRVHAHHRPGAEGLAAAPDRGPRQGDLFTPEGKKAILNKLIEAEGFEKFSGLRFLGTKRFGVDGGEAVIPALEQIIKRGGQLGVKEIVLGMAHRGRLNVLANVLGKPYRQIFHEFQGGAANPSEVEGSGDVKYHLGASSDREFDGKKVHLSLTANPSHLEAEDGVVLGKARAKQYQLGDTAERIAVLPLLLHGDAAFAGQGVVAECFAMSGTKGFKTGGTIHVVINNQIGFTTAPIYSRSSPYPSDIALMVQAPIFHVNGDDPEAVVHVARIATEFRQLFHKDVVIDIFCYRRFGHNETDEPAFTAARDVSQDQGARDDAGALCREAGSGRHAHRGRREDDDRRLQQAAGRGIRGIEIASPQPRRLARRPLERLCTCDQGRPPRQYAGKVRGPAHGRPRADHRSGGFNLHKTIARQLEAKAKMFESGEGFDWATAEALAFGTLLDEGFPVRLSGQDTSRGTFSQRHSMLVDQETEERYVPLNHIREGQAEFEVVDSLLSEEAVLGFEYGYSLAEPKALVLWEAQFGDFANGAQVVIDQFIASGEMKWLRMSGLVMLLPHGYEGQGAGALLGAARALSAALRTGQYPGLLSDDAGELFPHPAAANAPAVPQAADRDGAEVDAAFQALRLLPHRHGTGHFVPSHLPRSGRGGAGRDDGEARPGHRRSRRVILCTGKVYFDLMDEREKRDENRVQILRIEQLYPFPEATLAQELRRFPKANIVWCQEEPKNQGAWHFIEQSHRGYARPSRSNERPHYVGRPEYASTAAGLMSQHNAELKAFLNEALTL
jgi:2-oxoglutarate dehydrogenase E1 component